MQLQARVLAMKFNGLRLVTASWPANSRAWPGWSSSCRAASSTTSWPPSPSTSWANSASLYEDSPHLRAHGAWQQRYMFDLGLIIGGGTAQIQKNIISERGLGMPREPKTVRRPDRHGFRPLAPTRS